MAKRFASLSLVYAITAMVFGVFYREFTKLNGFEGDTRLSVIHTHYFVLGMLFFLVLMLIEKSLDISSQKNIGRFVFTYNIGINITGAAFLARGLTQVFQSELSKGADASISGAAGIGHITMGVSLILLLLKVKKAAAENQIKQKIK